MGSMVVADLVGVVGDRVGVFESVRCGCMVGNGYMVFLIYVK